MRWLSLVSSILDLLHMICFKIVHFFVVIHMDHWVELRFFFFFVVFLGNEITILVLIRWNLSLYLTFWFVSISNFSHRWFKYFSSIHTTLNLSKRNMIIINGIFVWQYARNLLSNLYQTFRLLIWMVGILARINHLWHTLNRQRIIIDFSLVIFYEIFGLTFARLIRLVRLVQHVNESGCSLTLILLPNFYTRLPFRHLMTIPILLICLILLNSMTKSTLIFLLNTTSNSCRPLMTITGAKSALIKLCRLSWLLMKFANILWPFPLNRLHCNFDQIFIELILVLHDILRRLDPSIHLLDMLIFNSFPF